MYEIEPANPERVPKNELKQMMRRGKGRGLQEEKTPTVDLQLAARKELFGKLPQINNFEEVEPRRNVAM